MSSCTGCLFATAGGIERLNSVHKKVLIGEINIETCHVESTSVVFLSVNDECFENE